MNVLGKDYNTAQSVILYNHLFFSCAYKTIW